MMRFFKKAWPGVMIFIICNSGTLHAAETRTPTPDEFRELVKQYNQPGIQGQRLRPAQVQPPKGVEQFNRAIALHSKKGASASELKEAAQLYQAAANAGITAANTNLALLYLDGRGVKKDVNKALSLLNAASKKNDLQADIALARLYLSGKDVKMDEKKGESYLNKAAKAGNQTAIKMLADYKAWKKKNELAMKEYQEIIKKAQLSQAKPQAVQFPPRTAPKPSLKELLNPEPNAEPFPLIPGQEYLGMNQPPPYDAERPPIMAQGDSKVSQGNNALPQSVKPVIQAPAPPAVQTDNLLPQEKKPK